MKKSFTAKTLIVSLCLMLLFCLILSGCKSRDAAAADRLFEQLNVDAPDGEAIAEAQEAYAGLSAEDREELEHYEQFVQAEARYKADEVDALIKSIGTVTLQSGNAVDAARKAYDALDDAARALVSGADDLTAAEESFHRLKVEEAAADIDALITAIGDVSLEDEANIAAARSAYDAADEEVQSAVQNLSELEKTEEQFHKLEVAKAAEEIDTLIDAIGEVTLESGESIDEARSAYDIADEEIKAEVRNLRVLEEAEERLVYLGKKVQAEEMDAIIASLGTITAESEEAVKKVREQFEQLPEDIRELVETADLIDKAEYTIQGLKDKAAASKIKKLVDNKKYDDAIAFVEEYIGNRKAKDIQGSVVKNALKAYVAKANALMKKSRYEEAEKLLNNCKKRYSGADMADVNKAINSLKKAISEPANGKVFTSKAKGGYCTLKIKAGDTPVFVKIVNINDPKSFVSVYVRANKSTTVHIRNGKYTLKYATGSKWYGSKDLFGSDTRYYSADTTLDMSISRSGNYIYYQTYTITLYTVVGGNLSTSKISQEDF